VAKAYQALAATVQQQFQRADRGPELPEAQLWRARRPACERRSGSR
jgi:hypothetical protein